MKPYQERVLGEKKELDKKISKLGVFYYGEGVAMVEAQELRRLAEQLDLMSRYSLVLRERIAAFTDE